MSGRIVSDKVLESFSYPSLDELAFLVSTIEKKYPDINNPDHAERIRQQFPKLTDEEIDNNMDKIQGYYLKHIQYEVIDTLSRTMKNKKINSSGRVAYVYDMCPNEFWFMAAHLTSAQLAADAFHNALSFTVEKYGTHSDDHKKSNAFKHAIWNALLAKYHGKKKKNVNKGRDFAKGLTDAHEDCNIDNGAPGWATAMDLHNNHVGRLVYKWNSSVSGSWPNKKFNTLYDWEFKEDLYARSGNAIKVNESIPAINAINDQFLVYTQD